MKFAEVHYHEIPHQQSK